MVRLLDVDPDLASALSERQVRAARCRSEAAVFEVPGPHWDPGAVCESATPAWLGLWVVQGVLIQVVRVAGRSACQLLGPGDVLRPWDAPADHEQLVVRSTWRIARPARLAVLDARFAQNIAAWPTLLSALMRRLADRPRTLALAQAISQIPNTEARLLITFWLLADRWGRVGPEGVLITLPLTHEILAMLVGVQRPTVTLALGRLSDAGLLSRPKRDGWLLTRRAGDFLHEEGNVERVLSKVAG